jgi:excisionase family DNA binding protein
MAQKKTPKPAERDKLLTAREVARMFRCSASAVYVLAREREIPCIRLSKRMMRFPETAILEWFNSRAA